MSLRVYRKKRDFNKTREPKGEKAKNQRRHSFVIQKHDASHLHYDFRLEMDGVLKSWAVPKGPSLNPGEKRLAVQVEDHPVSYANFEGEIPADEYGGGHVIVWDRGEWISEKDIHQQLRKGRLEFTLNGEKLLGSWILVRTGRVSSKKPNWLLIKRHDAHATDKIDVTDLDKSVISDITIEELKEGADLKKATKLKLKKSKSETKAERPASLKSLKRSMPKTVEPQLAFLADRAPMGEQWIHEVKYDGYRTLATVDGRKCKLLTRNGFDWTEKYGTIRDELKKIKVKSAIFDGEVVVLDNTHSSFQALQNALENNEQDQLVYYIFDLLYLNGNDLRDLPLIQRKTLLAELLKKNKSKKIHYSEHWTEEGERIFKGACKLGLEGIISKDQTKPYESGRSRHWLKTKCKNTQEFVIVGYSLQKNQSALGALLLGGYNSSGRLEYAGRVGTGFNFKTHGNILSQLKKMRQDSSALEVKKPNEKSLIWVEPKLVANVEFSNWTDEHVIRHASFQGLRKDKKATEVLLDEVKVNKKVKNKKKLKESSSESLEISNPQKVLFSKAKVTKLELAQYYIDNQKLILPHIKNRPLSLLRCPNGDTGECFFQKHVTTESKAIHKVKIHSDLKKKDDEIFYVDSIEGIIEAIQLGSLELHVRGGDYKKVDYPNIIVFDFDPDPSVGFAKVKTAALELRKLLTQLKLKSFVKTTGGKGLHVHVPIAEKYDWDQVKNFSKTVCEKMVEDEPKLYTTEISKAKRKDKIFLDYLRNGYGATAIVPYSVRAKPNASVAWPIRWEDLRSIKSSDQFTIRSIQKLRKKSDPWLGYFKLKQKIKLLEK